MRVLIFGAGRVGTNLARFLEKKHEITIVDMEKSVCDRLASESDFNVVCGDTTDPALLDDLKHLRRETDGCGDGALAQRCDARKW